MRRVPLYMCALHAMYGVDGVHAQLYTNTWAYVLYINDVHVRLTCVL